MVVTKLPTCLPPTTFRTRSARASDGIASERQNAEPRIALKPRPYSSRAYAPGTASAPGQSLPVSHHSSRESMSPASTGVVQQLRSQTSSGSRFRDGCTEQVPPTTSSPGAAHRMSSLLSSPSRDPMPAGNFLQLDGPPRSRDASPSHRGPSNGIIPRDPAGFSVATSKAARPMSARQASQSLMNPAPVNESCWTYERPTSARPASTVGMGRIKAAINSEFLGSHTVASFAHQTLTAAVNEASAALAGPSSSPQRIPLVVAPTLSTQVESPIASPSAADDSGTPESTSGTPRSRPPRAPYHPASRSLQTHFSFSSVLASMSSTGSQKAGSDDGSMVQGSMEGEEQPVTPSRSRLFGALESARWASIGHMASVSRLGLDFPPPTDSDSDK